MLKLLLKVAARSAFDWCVFAVTDTRELWKMLGEVRQQAGRPDGVPDTSAPPRPGTGARG